MTEAEMMHGVDYIDQDVSGWLASEKIDGCRAFWDGYDMWTRGGRLIAVPSVMRARLPEGIMLDGEMNAGRGWPAFELARQAVQYGRFCDAVVFSAFDAPDAEGTFADRHAFLRHILPDRGIVHYIAHEPCEGIVPAVKRMIAVQSEKGEGLVLRDPDGRYRPGRTDALLKLKAIPEVLYADDGSVPALR